MCTLNTRLGSTDDYPLIVIANRDEFYARGSTSPSTISENPVIFAPRDLEAGGTWFGVNEWGLVAAITNVWLKPRAVQPTRSRGLLTLDVLRCETVNQVSDLIYEKIREDTYDFFNLLAASRVAATVFTLTGKLREYSLSEGSATILNTPFSPDEPEGKELPPLGSEGDAADRWLREIRQFLSRHPEVCKHSGVYGTRSSQVVALGNRSDDKFWYADGPPCRTEFEDLSSQFQSVFHPASLPKARI